jgi:hypothetical protein
MLVKELIEVLKSMDQDKDVVLWNEEYDCKESIQQIEELTEDEVVMIW